MTAPTPSLESLLQRAASARFGVLELREGRLVSVLARWWPTVCSRWSVWWAEVTRRFRAGDRCWIHYNQPWGSPNYLAIKLVVGSRGTSPATLRHGLAVVDEIARRKGADALVAEVANHRVSHRAALREGWEPHLTHGPLRHYIKRFYGSYPPPLLERRPCRATLADDRVARATSRCE